MAERGMRGLTDLHADILIVIAEALAPRDLLALRLVNAYLHRVYSLDPVWRRVYRHQWGAPPDLVPPNPPPNCGFQSFGERSRTDAQILSHLHCLTAPETQYPEKQAASAAIWLFGVAAAPLLTGVATPNRHDGLHRQWVAAQLLEALRFGQAFETIRSVLAGDCTLLLEEVWVKVSAFDPATPTMWHYRNQVVSATLNLYDHLVAAEPARSPTGAALMMLKALFRTIKPLPAAHGVLNGLTQFFIYRVYAGTARGHHLVVASILQTLCGLRGVDCYASQSLVVVVDPGFPQHRAYLQLGQKGARVFTHRQVLASLLLLGVNPTEAVLALVFDAVTAKDVVETLGRFPPPLGLDVPAVSATLTTSANPETSPSSTSVRPLYFEFIGLVYNWMASDYAPYLWHQVQGVAAVGFHHLLPSLWGLAPETLRASLTAVTVSDPFVAYNLQPVNGSFVSEQPRYAVGEVVRHDQTDLLHVVIGWKVHETTLVQRTPLPLAEAVTDTPFTLVTQRRVYYNGLNSRGEASVVREESLSSVSDSHQAERFTLTWNIGCFFERYDAKRCRYVPLRALRDMYPNK